MREQTKDRRLELQIQPPLASSVQRPFLVAQPKVPEGLSTPLVRDAVRFQEAVKGAPNAVGTARLPKEVTERAPGSKHVGSGLGPCLHYYSSRRWGLP